MQNVEIIELNEVVDYLMTKVASGAFRYTNRYELTKDSSPVGSRSSLTRWSLAKFSRQDIDVFAKEIRYLRSVLDYFSEHFYIHCIPSYRKHRALLDKSEALLSKLHSDAEHRHAEK